MTKKTPRLSTLERIRAIIEADLSAIEEASAGALDGTSARKLCDYAKLEIALQKHDADMLDAQEAQELAKKEYEALKAQVQKALAAPLPTSEQEDDE